MNTLNQTYRHLLAVVDKQIHEECLRKTRNMIRRVQENFDKKPEVGFIYNPPERYTDHPIYVGQVVVSVGSKIKCLEVYSSSICDSMKYEKMFRRDRPTPIKICGSIYYVNVCATHYYTCYDLMNFGLSMVIDPWQVEMIVPEMVKT